MSTGPGDKREQAVETSIVPTSLPSTSPQGITVPVQIVSDRELGIGRSGAHAAEAATAPPDAGMPMAPPPPPPPVGPPLMIAPIALWSGLVILLVVALVAGIGALSRDIFSASGFVHQYLSALARNDAEAALAFPGVELDETKLQAAGLPSNAASVLLRDSVLNAPREVRLVGETEKEPGVHAVSFEYELGGQKLTSEFTVEHTGSWFGIFDNWRFASSPLAVISVSVLHDAVFTVNGLTLDTRAHAPENQAPSFSNSASYLAFTPSLYEFSHDSRLLHASPTVVPVTTGGAREVSVDVQPSAAFVSDVQNELNGYLDKCVTQQVLQPAGCPFGITIDDRVVGLPSWSMLEYPIVTLTGGKTAFEMPPTSGTVHVVVEVQSLFDGEMSTVDEDKPFEIALAVVIRPNGSLAIELH
ncbi:hypothetical protein [Luethyella okanaganae]|uniref:Uncharacterized protein n=1 Tax=Luethyella okanaganae TaxID=69372 RepID=A0ABW1VHM3_9MICO